MTIKKDEVVTIALGILGAGILLILLHNLFGGRLAHFGASLHGATADGHPAPGADIPLPPAGTK